MYWFREAYNNLVANSESTHMGAILTERNKLMSGVNTDLEAMN